MVDGFPGLMGGGLGYPYQPKSRANNRGSLTTAFTPQSTCSLRRHQFTFLILNWMETRLIMPVLDHSYSSSAQDTCC